MEEIETKENDEVEETKEEETTTNEVESKQQNDSYSKSDIDSKFILFEDRIKAYINEVLSSKNENIQNEEQESNNEMNWE